MTAPVIASYSTDTTGGVTDTTVSLAKPSGLVADDLIIAIFCDEQANNNDCPDITSPDAYTRITHGNNSQDVQAAIYWRVATGDETWPLVIAGSSGDYAVGWCLRITGADTSTPIHKTGSWGGVGAQASSGTITQVTTTVDDCLAIAMIGRDGSDVTPCTFSGTGWSVYLSLEDPSNNANGVGADWGYKTVAEAGGSVDCGWSSSASDGWVGIQIAIAPGLDATLPMDELTLASSPQAIDAVPGPVIVVLNPSSPNALQLTGSPQTLTVDAPIPPVTIPMDELTLASSPQALSVLRNVLCDELTLAGSAETLSIDAPITIATDELTLASAPQIIDIDAPITIVLDELTLASSPEIISVLPGGVNVPTDELTLASSAEIIQVAPGEVQTPTDELTLASSAEILTIFISVAVPLDELTLASSIEDLSVDAPITIATNELTLAGSAPIITPVPGEIQVPTDELTLASSVEALIPFTTIPVDELTLASSPEILAVAPGEAIVPLDELTLASSPEDLSVLIPIILDELTLASSIEALTVDPGEVQVPLDELTLASSAVYVHTWLPIPMDGLTLASSAETLSIFITVSIPLDELTLASSAPTIAVAPGPVLVPTSELTLASTIEDLIVFSEVFIPIDELTLSGTCQTLSVIPGEAVILALELSLASTIVNVSAVAAAGFLPMATLVLVATPGLEAAWPHIDIKVVPLEGSRIETVELEGRRITSVTLSGSMS